MKRLDEDKKKKRISNKSIAFKTGMSEGTISNWFRKFKIPFHKFVEVINIIYSEDKPTQKLLIEQFLENTDKIENIKEAVEWYLITFQTQKAEQLILKHREDHSLFLVYELLVKRTNGLLDKEEFFKEVELLRDNNSQQKDFLSLIKIANMLTEYDFRGFDKLQFLSKETLIFIEDLNNDFLKESYTLRIQEGTIISNLMKGNINVAKTVAMDIINNYKEEKYPLHLAKCNSLLSEMYLFNDYKSAINYNGQALRILKNSFGDNKYNQSVYESTHDFIKIFHGVYTNLFLTGKAEAAYYFAKTGDSEKALFLLDEIEKKKGTLSPFQLYYKGLALNSQVLLDQAKYEFIRNGNIHYIKLFDNI